MQAKPSPYLSVVIPVYHEEKTLPLLEARLFPALDALNKPYEVLFVNDGSKDDSQAVLETMFSRHPAQVRVVQLARNAGQHKAIIAGFALVRGQVVVTLDCDLQNPPEDIANLVAKIEEGHDVVGGWRASRQDSTWRKTLSRASNALRERITHMRMKDQGCMLRAYRRDIIDQIVASPEATPFIPELSWYFASNPTEIQVSHEERAAGTSTYNLYRLLRLNFDLMTSSSLLPLQLFTLIGLLLSAASGVLVVWLGLRRIFLGPEAEGLFTLFAILFLLVSVAITGLGLIGEYVGRIYLEVRRRPHYMVKRVIEQGTEP
jgi:undecaprenyl-phosphate 4-deoxy-4-formamido-L-arabinose transferase